MASCPIPLSPDNHPLSQEVSGIPYMFGNPDTILADIAALIQAFRTFLATDRSMRTGSFLQDIYPLTNLTN